MNITEAYSTYGEDTNTTFLSYASPYVTASNQEKALPSKLHSEMLSLTQGVCFGLKCLGTEREITRREKKKKKQNETSVIVTYILCPVIHVEERLLIHCGHRRKSSGGKNTVMAEYKSSRLKVNTYQRRQSKLNSTLQERSKRGEGVGLSAEPWEMVGVKELGKREKKSKKTKNNKTQHRSASHQDWSP